MILLDFGNAGGLMLFQSRQRTRDNNATVYHYCTSDALLSILQNRTIRFSDLNLLNDAEEGRWGYDVFIKAANVILKRENLPDIFPTIGEDFIDRIDAIWTQYPFKLANFVACFSIDGDSLSQWRAYANDGTGFAIGFRAAELARLPVRLFDVSYDPNEQRREMIAAIAAIYSVFKDQGEDYEHPSFFEHCALLAAQSIAFKNPAWRDEKEVRCHHAVNVQIQNDVWRLSDSDGEQSGSPAEGLPIQFRANRGTLISFIDMPFEVSAEHQPVAEIVLGPNNPNGSGNLRFVLGNHGYTGVTLRSAGAAYR